MKKNIATNNINNARRKFLRGATAIGASGLIMPIGSLSPLALNLAAMANASAQTATDYRALVCIYVGGGNDHLNTLVPTDPTSYNAYSTARGALAQAKSSLLSITPATSQGGKEVSLHASLGGLKTLFDAQRLAVVASVGALIVPVTKTAYYGSVALSLPPQLFSHSDQGNFWFSSQSNGLQNGWGGRFCDVLSGSNTNAAFTSISVFGYTKMLVGQTTTFFTASEQGAPLQFFDAGSGLDKALTGSAARTNLLEKAYAQVNENLRDNGRILENAILPESALPVPPGGGNSGIANQLQSVARIIGGRTALGTKRQVFYVSLGGFDTHSGQVDKHASLLTELNAAMVYFDQCMATLGTTNQVTTFTTSEFGRTLTSNGDGTDHGWASHHFVMGGAVNGKNIYGTLPTIGNNGPDFLNEGNQIPTLAVEQYGATLAKWMGVGDANINNIFPNLGNFNQRDLGFLKA